jgi:hypothetical protein
MGKLNNLLKFDEYDHLQPKQKPTKYTEIGGYAINESYESRDEKILFIKTNIDEASNEFVDHIFKMLHEGVIYQKFSNTRTDWVIPVDKGKLVKSGGEAQPPRQVGGRYYNTSMPKRVGRGIEESRRYGKYKNKF